MYLDIYLERVSRKYVCVGDCERKQECEYVCMRVCVCVCERAKRNVCEIKHVREREREKEDKYKYIY